MTARAGASRGVLTAIACGLAIGGVALSPRAAAAQARIRDDRASAQTSAPPSAQAPRGTLTGGRLELSGGVGWTGGWDVGSAAATLTGNGAPGGTPVTLFDVETQVDGGPRFEGRVGWHLTPTIAVEAGLAVTRTHLRTDVRNDVEQAPPITASERFTEYAIEGGLVVQVPRLTFAGGRARPFVTGGAGYVRQAHEGSTRIDTGQIYFAGGGATLVLRQAGRAAFLETLGLRGTARLDVRTGGFELEPQAGSEVRSETGTRVGPSVTAAFFVRF